MQVRRTHAEGIEQHLVQEFNDRSVFNLRDAGLLVVRDTVGGRFVELEFATDDLLHRFGGGDRIDIHQLEQFVVLGNHPIQAKLGRELDLFHRFLVGRVGCRYGQAIVALAQHHHAVGLADLVVQQAFGQALGVDGIKIHQRRGVGGGHGVRQIRRRNRT